MTAAGLTAGARAALFAAVAAVPDPEIPVLTIADLGVLRSVEEVGGRVVVTITPTYSGCPALRFMADQITAVLQGAGVEGEVRTVLSPAWTTDWMSPEGRDKLEAFGIAPPHPAAAPAPGGPGAAVPVTLSRPVRCPHCRSTATAVVSEFGSTACKALHRCLDCLEPFDYFKGL